jgi:N-acetylglutamate synthase-like GNAT family acetyltransferase
VLRAEEGEVVAQGSVDIDVGQSAKTSKSKTKSKTKATTGTTTAVAEIRHFTVNAPLRSFGIGTELLAAALDTAFSPSSSISRVIVLSSPYTSGGERVFTKCGFVPVSPEPEWRTDAALGFTRKAGRWLAVDAAKWAAARPGVFAKKLTG